MYPTTNEPTQIFNVTTLPVQDV